MLYDNDSILMYHSIAYMHALSLCIFRRKTPLRPFDTRLQMIQKEHLYFSVYIRLLLFISMLCSGKGKRFSNREETSCLPLLDAGFEPRVSDTKSPAD